MARCGRVGFPGCAPYGIDPGLWNATPSGYKPKTGGRDSAWPGAIAVVELAGTPRHDSSDSVSWVTSPEERPSGAATAVAMTDHLCSRKDFGAVPPNSAGRTGTKPA